MPGPVADEVLRLVYGADAALVARHSGVGKESGLVMDAARLGVPLLVSDHDSDLTARLAGQPWARSFPAGDAVALAEALDKFSAEVPARPGPSARAVLDLYPAAEQTAFLTTTYTRLLKECRR